VTPVTWRRRVARRAGGRRHRGPGRRGNRGGGRRLARWAGWGYLPSGTGSSAASTSSRSCTTTSRGSGRSAEPSRWPRRISRPCQSADPEQFISGGPAAAEMTGRHLPWRAQSHLTASAGSRPPNHADRVTPAHLADPRLASPRAEGTRYPPDVPNGTQATPARPTNLPGHRRPGGAAVASGGPDDDATREQSRGRGHGAGPRPR
jgi:hypothetical protein